MEGMILNKPYSNSNSDICFFFYLNPPWTLICAPRPSAAAFSFQSELMLESEEIDGQFHSSNKMSSTNYLFSKEKTNYDSCLSPARERSTEISRDPWC
jgi:hypothetical protein